MVIITSCVAVAAEHGREFDVCMLQGAALACASGECTIETAVSRNIKRATAAGHCGVHTLTMRCADEALKLISGFVPQQACVA